MMTESFDGSRRTALSGLFGVALGTTLARRALAANKDENVSPPEDLMREHGILNRVLLVYEEVLRRLVASQEFDPANLDAAARIIRNFVEDYHERQEEQYLFPRFERANRLVPLVTTLRQQHDAGRRLTDIVLASGAKSRTDGDARRKTVASLQAFIRMYRPHEAREDTELFPALRSIVSPHEFDALGEEFETNEHKLFGGDGFEMYVARVASIEKNLDINDLNQFTPQ
jgi:hemerythrin-like domain-containing protein